METARTINTSTLVQLRDVTAKLDEIRLAHDICDKKLKFVNDEIEKLRFSYPTCLGTLDAQSKAGSNCELLKARLLLRNLLNKCVIMRHFLELTVRSLT